MRGAGYTRVGGGYTRGPSPPTTVVLRGAILPPVVPRGYPPPSRTIPGTSSPLPYYPGYVLPSRTVPGTLPPPRGTQDGCPRPSVPRTAAPTT